MSDGAARRVAREIADRHDVTVVGLKNTAYAGRRFAWVDDEITDADRTWVAANHSVSTLLHA